METVLNKKVIYFGDMMYSRSYESLEEEFNGDIHPEFMKNGVKFSEVKFTESPPFDENFDILLFDWGGMSLGNDMIGSLTRKIARDAVDFPSKLYVMVSSMSKWAMEDAKKEGIEYPNIFLSIPEFCDYWKKLK